MTNEVNHKALSLKRAKMVADELQVLSLASEFMEEYEANDSLEDTYFWLCEMGVFDELDIEDIDTAEINYVARFIEDSCEY